MIRQYDYTKFAKYYDIVELGKIDAEKQNNFVKSILLRYGVKSFLDMTAGTGSQSIFLAKHFNVTANDINKAMLSIAKKNAEAQRLHIRFNIGDMRSVRLGKFDAVISIFNAIAHLSKAGFAKALKNINSNLKSGGIYIFDVLNAK